MKKDDDPFGSKEWEAYAKHIREELVPMISDSAITMQLVPDQVDVDVKFAVELGFCIMLDKPIVAIVSPGTRVPAKLVAVADEIVEGSPGDPTFDIRLMEAVHRMQKKANQ